LKIFDPRVTLFFRSLKVIGTETGRSDTYDFLLTSDFQSFSRN